MPANISNQEIRIRALELALGFYAEKTTVDGVLAVANDMANLIISGTAPSPADVLGKIIDQPAALAEPASVPQRPARAAKDRAGIIASKNSRAAVLEDDSAPEPG